MKKCIVTGANGFVGSALIKKLTQENVEVYAVVKDEHENADSIESLKNCRIIYCDLNDIETLPDRICERNFDAFYHFAWISAGGAGRSDYNIQLLNAKYTCDCAVAAKKMSCRKFLASGTITEKIAENVLNIKCKSENIIYGIAKHTTHCMLDVICNKLELNYIWMQFSNLYGPHSLNGNIVQYTIGRLLKGEKAEFGPAVQPYDLLYIDDLALILYEMGKNNLNQNCYYLGSSSGHILKDYLMEIGKIMNKRDLISIGAREDDGTRYDVSWFDSSPILSEIGNIKFTSFENGIKNTINWIEGAK